MSSVLLWTKSVCEETVCVDAAIRHQGEMFIWSKENHMAYDSKYLDRMLQLHGRNLQPSWRAMWKQEKET